MESLGIFDTILSFYMLTKKHTKDRFKIKAYAYPLFITEFHFDLHFMIETHLMIASKDCHFPCHKSGLCFST